MRRSPRWLLASPRWSCLLQVVLLVSFLGAGCGQDAQSAKGGVEAADTGHDSASPVEVVDAGGIADGTDVAEAPDAAATEQPLPPGLRLLSPGGYIEYVTGDAPVILAVPHDGDFEPEAIPDRQNATTVRDLRTQKLGRLIAAAFYERTGRHIHLVVNRLARTKLDANRDLEEAAQGDAVAEQAWHEFHGFIDEAKFWSVEQYRRALFLDLHGHGHAIQRVELGYLLSASTLREDDEVLDSSNDAQRSSIRTLYEDNASFLSFSELLRGPSSFGALLEERDVASVPSPNAPAPEAGWGYFSGGFNTWVHGSRDGGEVSAIQVEVNRDHRNDDDTLSRFAEAFAAAVHDYLTVHYGLTL